MAGQEPTHGQTVGDVGEFGLIDRVVAELPQTHDVLLGPGDDAAVVSAPDRRVVVTTDLLVEHRHFRRDWSSAYDIGCKAAAQNLADVAAMGARATALVVGLGVPASLELAWVRDLARGLADEATAAGAAVVGGDTVASQDIVVAVTAFGDLEGRAPVTRTGAKVGDVVVVGGRLGWAEAGVRLLAGGVTVGRYVDAHRRPHPPYTLGPALAAAGATAMLDVSDGLLQDAGHIAASSRVGLDLSSAPVLALGGEGISAEEVWSGGEDHALLACLPAAASLPDGVVVVGAVVAREGVYVDGVPASGRRGHDHFAR